ncbi:hypothetical protein [Halomicrobium salinisoli]|uniref:hypothetical protein n=1 Tax=Halomicrobium salinisoli TaxID=2878391 RepID=UPI001CEFD3FF|nr:hypothetical protein [Halomicrobium salinisoli]
MSERTRDREVDETDVGDVDVGDLGAGADGGDLGVDQGVGDGDFGVAGGPDERTTDAETQADAGVTGRAKARATSLFSPRAFLLALGAALVGVFALGNLIPVVPFTGFLGLLLVMVGGGLVSSAPRYLEAGVAGAASGALALAVGSITLTFVTGGLPVAVGAAVGAAVALVGFYAGRDLRDGLTKDLE